MCSGLSQKAAAFCMPMSGEPVFPKVSACCFARVPQGYNASSRQETSFNVPAKAARRVQVHALHKHTVFASLKAMLFRFTR